MSRTRTKPNLNKQIQGEITAQMIEDGKGCEPTKCMYKIGTAVALNIPHGYIKVDASGISITRRTDFREKAFLTQIMKNNMILFDKFKEEMEAYRKGMRDEEPVCPVKPHKFKLTFHQTTRVYRSSDERKKKINEARRIRKAEGRPDRKYYLHQRVIGLAVSPDILKRVSNI